MLIQASVPSTSYGTTFTSSISATGVEQTVSRAPIAPVEESNRNAGPQNQTNYSQSASTPAGAAQPAPNSGTAQASADEDAVQGDQDDSSTRPGQTVKAKADSEQQQAEADQVVIDQLKARDREVRIHEAAHAATGGRYAGSASFEYQRGPDGQNYAVGGEVSISTGPVPGDPQATLEKARTIRAAALAPAEPSSQDRRVAAEAGQLEVDARTQIREQEIQARAEAEKAREQAAAEKQARADQQQPVEDEESTETETVEESDSQPVFTPVAVQSSQQNSEAEDTASSDDQKQGDEPARPNARAQLEKILLSSGGVLMQANRQGLVDPQNPFGKSGYLDIIA